MRPRRVDRRNRRRFTLLGLLLIALGVCGLLLRAALLALPEPSELYDLIAEQARLQPPLAIAALILLGLLLVLLGLYVLRQQFPSRTTRIHELALTQGGRGRTTVDADVITRALGRDMARQPGVYEARARLVEVGPAPRILVRASVDEDADVPQLRAALEDSFDRTTQVLGAAALEAHLLVKPIPPPRSRVR
jgi:hypothetical protein